MAVKTNPKMTKFPSKWSEIQSKFSQLVYQIIYFDESKETSYTLVRNGLCGEIYRLFVNCGNPELTAFMEAHEIGHVIFGHTKNNEIKSAINKIKVKAAYQKVKKYFEDADAFYAYFQRMIYNIVLDMEVNGKLFTEEEQLFREKEKAKLFEYEQQDPWGCWAPAYGFPNGLDAATYLSLILQNPEKFVNDLQNNMGDGEGQIDQHGQQDDGGGDGEEKQGEGEQSQGSGNGQSKSKSGEHGKGKTKPRKFTKEELEKLKKLIELEDAEEARKEEEARMEREQRATNGEYGNEGTGSNKVDIQSASSSKDLEKMLLNMLTRAQVQKKRNMMYYYNRRKFGTNMLIPKTTQETYYERPKMYILVDVSGSISEQTLNKFAGLFKGLSKKLNRGCRFIAWDTSLEGDYDINNMPKHLNAGGGTDMAGGLEYIYKTWSPSGRDAVIMVSDYCDNLERWIDIIDRTGMKNLHGVMWVNRYDEDNYYLENNERLLKQINTIKFSLESFN